MRYLSIFAMGNINFFILIKVIIIILPKYLSYILPISFYFSIIIMYEKFSKNNEFIMFFSCGNNWLRYLKVIFLPALLLFFIEIALTTIIVPKVNYIYYFIKSNYAKPSLINFIHPKRIMILNKSQQAIYIKSKNIKNTMHNVFIQQKRSQNKLFMINAHHAHITTSHNANEYFIF